MRETPSENRLEKVLIGNEPNILSFTMGFTKKPKEFEKLLIDGDYKFTNIGENSFYIIYNTPLEYCKKLFKGYNQESFVWGRYQDGKISYEYWQKPENSDCYKKLIQNDISTIVEVKKLFSKLREYNFLIPFNFDEQLDEDFSDIDNYTLEDISYMNNYVDGKFSGYNNYIHHKQIQSRIKK